MRIDPPPQTPFAPWTAVRAAAGSDLTFALSVLSLALLAPAVALFPPPASAQTTAAQPNAPDSTYPQKPIQHHKHPSPAHALPAPDPAILAPVAPPTPHWPLFDKPAEASVVWDSHGLTIDAANSSLAQILKDFSSDTGAKVEGFSSDQRVFGAYGPGPARDVLSQVLQGSGYNVLMIGDQGQGVPRQILLSVRSASASQPGPRNTASGNEEDDSEEQPQQPAAQEPVSGRPGFPPGVPPRSPQQIMQEMQLRQQQLQQQQGPAQQPNPPNPPN